MNVISEPVPPTVNTMSPILKPSLLVVVVASWLPSAVFTALESLWSAVFRAVAMSLVVYLPSPAAPPVVVKAMLKSLPKTLIFAVPAAVAFNAREPRSMVKAGGV